MECGLRGSGRVGQTWFLGAAPPVWGAALFALGAGGCAVEPGPECVQLLDCAADADPGALDALDQAYGPYASCWNGPWAAKACEEECRIQVDAYRPVAPLSHRCGGTGDPPSNEVFLSIDDWYLEIAPYTASDCFINYYDLEFATIAFVGSSEPAFTAHLVLDHSADPEVDLDCMLDGADFVCDPAIGTDGVEYVVQGELDARALHVSLWMTLNDVDVNGTECSTNLLADGYAPAR